MQTLRRSVMFLLMSGLSLIALPAAAQQVIATVAVGTDPAAVAVNSATNQTYVANLACTQLPCPGPGSVTVINGASDTTNSIAVGVYPVSVAVNPVTNKIYVANECGTDVNCAGFGTLTIIDGATNTTSTIGVGALPYQVVVNPITNLIYVVNDYGNDPTGNSAGTVTIIDGSDPSNTATVGTGYFPYFAAVNTVTNEVYVVNNCGDDPTCASPGTVTIIDSANNTTGEVGVGTDPVTVAVNNVTNQIYVVNEPYDFVNLVCTAPGTVTVIDGASLGISNVGVAACPYNVSVDAVTNQIYVINQCGDDLSCGSPGTVSIIDGATNSASEVAVGVSPYDIGVDAVTNQIYIANNCGDDLSCQSAGTVSIIDGATQLVTELTVGNAPDAVGLNATTNQVYVANQIDDTVSVIAGAGGPAALQFVAVTPCRLVDTRTSSPIPGYTSENFYLPQLGGCGIPTSAAAYSLNVTALPIGRLGFLSIWPTGEDQPVVSTMNSFDGRNKANAAIVPAGYQGAVSIYVTNTSNLLLDVDGYFAPVSESTLAFYPVTPCRIVDTRGDDGPLGGPFLNANQERDFPILSSPCIPAGVSPQAYSFNVTAIPNPFGQPLGYLTVWPAGQVQPQVSTLNNPTGTTVANAAIVPVGQGGDIAVFPNDTTDLVVDINGYFAPAGSGGLSLYTQPPCRVLDTRQLGNGFVGKMVVNVEGSVCTPPATALAYVFNATVVPPGPLGFLTLWPNGVTQPTASTLNARDGAVTSNMAIVPTTNGLIDAYASSLTQLILDISSYYAP